jgi:hypothetical protein
MKSSASFSNLDTFRDMDRFSAMFSFYRKRKTCSDRSSIFGRRERWSVVEKSESEEVKGEFKYAISRITTHLELELGFWLNYTE